MACTHRPAGWPPQAKPGMLLALAEKYNVDLRRSHGGDDMDIEAGKAAGATTILIESDEKQGRCLITPARTCLPPANYRQPALGLFAPAPLENGVEGQEVRSHAKARNLTDTDRGDYGTGTKLFPGLNIAEMHFNGGDLHEDMASAGRSCKSTGPWIKDNPLVCALGPVDPVNQRPFLVGLKIISSSSWDARAAISSLI